MSHPNALHDRENELREDIDLHEGFGEGEEDNQDEDE